MLNNLTDVLYNGELVKRLRVNVEKFLTRGIVANDDCPVEVAVKIEDGDSIYLKGDIEPQIDDIVLVSTHTWLEQVLRHYEPHTSWAVFRSSYNRDDDMSEFYGDFTIDAVCVAIERKNGDIQPTNAHRRTININNLNTSDRTFFDDIRSAITDIQARVTAIELFMATSTP